MMDMAIYARDLRDIVEDSQKVEGWFSRDEARFMAELLVYALTSKSGPHNVVEIGSYKGRSSVVLASVIRLVSPESRLFCIDPFQGRTSKSSKASSTYNDFIANISSRGLDKYIEPVVMRSTDVRMEKQIRFIFIDGLHEYEDVRTDFEHFERLVEEDGIVAFHDRCVLCKGIIRFTNELVDGGRIHALGQADSFFGATLTEPHTLQMPTRGLPDPNTVRGTLKGMQC